jgi:molybdopterin converting factor small subunit
MAVTVKLNLPLQRLAGNREIIEVNGSTVRQCLDDLIRQIPAAGKEVYNADGSPVLLFLINHEAIPEQDLDHPVTDGDALWLLSVVSGG